jgi:hypothetical protein
MKRKLHIYLASTLAFVAILVSGCDRASKPNDTKTQWVDPNQLQPGPIRHESLTGEQMSRIQRLQRVFSEVDPSPIEKWMEDFKRDQNPDRELSVWEGIAAAYEKFTASRTLTLDAKKEVFQVTLLRSSAPEEDALKHLKLKILTEQDARDIMRLFSTRPAPLRVGSP